MAEYTRLLSRLVNAPVLLDETKLIILTEAVTVHLFAGNSHLIDKTPSGTNATKKEFIDSFNSSGRRLSIIPVFDTLVSKEVSAASGQTSYQALSDKIDRAVSEGATDIGFYLDTPGGEATGLFGLTDKIRNLSSRGISTFSFVDNATSAGYAIAAATQTIYANETALVGSIAALMVHMDQSKAAEQKGINYTVFRSKSEKAMGDSLTPLTSAATEKLNYLLASLDNSFNNDVVKGRAQLSVQDIINMKGASFVAGDAVALKLVDSITPSLENALSLHLKNSKFTSKQSKTGVRMNEEELKAALAASEASNLSLKEETESLKTALAESLAASEAAVLAERERVVGILSDAGNLSLSISNAKTHVEKGRSQEDALEFMEAIKGSLQEATATKGAGLNESLSGDENAPENKTSFLAQSLAKARGEFSEV